MRLRTAWMVFGLCLLPPVGAGATEPIGQIKTLTGDVSIIRTGTTVAAAPGDPVFLNDGFTTAENATVGVTFIDNATLSLGPESDLVVDRFVYDPAEGARAFRALLRGGLLALVSGDIAENNPDAALVETPFATIGVRGTRFVVRVETDQ